MSGVTPGHPPLVFYLPATLRAESALHSVAWCSDCWPGPAGAEVRNPRSLSSRPAWRHLGVPLEVRVESQGHPWLSWPHEDPAGLMGGDHSPPTPPPRLLSGTTFQPARPPSVHLSVHLSVRHLLTLRQCAQRKALPQPSGALHPGRVGRPSLLPWGTRSGPGMAVDAAEGFVGPAAAQTGSSPGPGTVAPQQPPRGQGPCVRAQ